METEFKNTTLEKTETEIVKQDEYSGILDEANGRNILIEGKKIGSLTVEDTSLYGANCLINFDKNFSENIDKVDITINGNGSRFFTSSFFGEEKKYDKNNNNILGNKDLKIGNNDLSISIKTKEGNIIIIKRKINLEAKKSQYGKIELIENKGCYLKDDIKDLLIRDLQKLNSKYLNIDFVVQVRNDLKGSFVLLETNIIQLSYDDNYKEIIYSLSHEFGHIIYFNLPKNLKEEIQNKVKEINIKMSNFFIDISKEDLINLQQTLKNMDKNREYYSEEDMEYYKTKRKAKYSIIRWFDESNYVKTKYGDKFGHPEKNERELFASAFNVYLYFKKDFFEKYYINATNEQKKVIDELFSMFELLEKYASLDKEIDNLDFLWENDINQ